MEEKSSVREIILIFVRKNLLFVGLISVGFLLVSVGIVQYLGQTSQSRIEFISASQPDVEGESTINEKVTVDVQGAVQNPGVFTLVNGQRLQDALISAGGLSSDADREYVSKKINQAQKVKDGMKIYIPFEGEIVSNVVNLTQGNSSDSELRSDFSENTSQTDGLIDINSASEGELDTLPKIGPVTAKKIIDGRPYTTIEELVSKKILGQKTFDGLKDKVDAL